MNKEGRLPHNSDSWKTERAWCQDPVSPPCKHCSWYGKVSWPLGAKEYHKVSISLAVYSLLRGKASPLQV